MQIRLVRESAQMRTSGEAYAHAVPDEFATASGSQPTATIHRTIVCTSGSGSSPSCTSLRSRELLCARGMIGKTRLRCMCAPAHAVQKALTDLALGLRIARVLRTAGPTTLTQSEASPSVWFEPCMSVVQCTALTPGLWATAVARPCMYSTATAVHSSHSRRARQSHH